MKITVEACGCIALPEGLARKMRLGPGAVLELVAIVPDSLRLFRVGSASTCSADQVICATQL